MTFYGDINLVDAHSNIFCANVTQWFVSIRIPNSSKNICLGASRFVSNYFSWTCANQIIQLLRHSYSSKIPTQATPRDYHQTAIGAKQKSKVWVNNCWNILFKIESQWIDVFLHHCQCYNLLLNSIINIHPRYSAYTCYSQKEMGVWNCLDQFVRRHVRVPIRPSCIMRTG